MRDLLDKNGFEKTESIMNEWNYVHGWSGDDMNYSLLALKGLKGAAFNLATMCTGQKGPVDMLMYYDARPCAWNGLFDMIQIGRVTTKAYHSFPVFHALYQLGSEVLSECDDPDVYVLAARNETEAALFITHFNNDDADEGTDFSLDLQGFSSENGTEATIYIHDEENDLQPVESIVYYGEKIVIKRKIPNFTSYLIKIKKL